MMKKYESLPIIGLILESFGGVKASGFFHSLNISDSFVYSCFLNGVHGDNCASVIVGDRQDNDTIGVNWQGVPYRADFHSDEDPIHYEEARRLVQTTYDSLYAAIDVCRPGGCLSDIGGAIQEIADAEGFSSVRKYRGHGIAEEFHCAPFVKHYKNFDRCELRPGMIFTIEPMLTQGSSDCFEWDDDWTVSTPDLGLAAQFEHTVLITDDGVEILTLPPNE
jgi:methionyl aminopeptidase